MRFFSASWPLWTAARFGVGSAQPQQVPLAGNDDKSLLNYGELEAFIDHQMEEWHLPGMSVAILDGDSSWFKGFGWARLNETPVTPETLFYGGSTTKSFTAAAMSLLVDDTKFPHVHWTAPVSTLIRDDFVLSDPWASEHVTIQDALSHRTGYPPHDLVAWTDPRAATRGLRWLPMSEEPRTTFQYSNQMFTMAGYLIEQLVGGRWLGHFLKERLWDPMGMNGTFFSLDDALASSSPLADEYWYHNDSDSFIAVAHAAHRGHEGAGGVISNVVDYARYLRHMMAETGPISKAGHAALKAPHMPIADDDPQFTGAYFYGHGWVGGVFAGERFWFHDGQMREHFTQLWMFPGRRFGVVLMANAQSAALRSVLWRIIYDRFAVDDEQRLDTGKADKQWSEVKSERLRTCIARLYPDAPKPPVARPVALSRYVGIFQAPGYGVMNITLECGDPPVVDGTPATPTVEDGCYLTASPPLEYEGKHFRLTFEHVTGDYWAAWGYLDDYAPLDGSVHRPALCLWTHWDVDQTGDPAYLGIDLQLHGVGDFGQIWYARIKG